MANARRRKPDIEIRNRVRELRIVRAGDLVAHPRNWRRHPTEQRAAMAGVLREIGYAGALLVREDGDGRLHLIDGHLRAETTPDAEVPVLVLDVDEHEADILLATVDPLSAMAERDEAVLRDLAATVEVEDAAVRALLDGLMAGCADANRTIHPDAAPQLGALTYRVIVDCEGEMHQAELLARFDAEGLPCRALIS